MEGKNEGEFYLGPRALWFPERRRKQFEKTVVFMIRHVFLFTNFYGKCLVSHQILK